MVQVGDVVRYRLDHSDAAAVRARRSSEGRRGPTVHAGDVVPVMVTSIDDGAVFGRAFLDASTDELLVGGALEGAEPGRWEPRS